jgi:hypothetical protein
MKYLCLAYYDTVKLRELSPEQLQELEAQCPKFDEMLRATGHLVMQSSLADPGAGASIRPWKGKPMMTDGPFIETKEQIGGMFMIEAKSLAQALQVASNHPAARIGEAVGWGIEIRPIEFLENYEAKPAT